MSWDRDVSNRLRAAAAAPPTMAVAKPQIDAAAQQAAGQAARAGKRVRVSTWAAGERAGIEVSGPHAAAVRRAARAQLAARRAGITAALRRAAAERLRSR